MKPDTLPRTAFTASIMPPEDIRRPVDFRAWDAWSPWEDGSGHEARSYRGAER
jgi:hypothetical protein